jgi:hypothetical protein
LEEEQEKLCRLCNEQALCNKFICYKKKQGKFDCSSCEERLCQHHWRIYFRKNI